MKVNCVETDLDNYTIVKYATIVRQIGSEVIASRDNREIRDFVRLTRAFLAITDGSCLEVSPTFSETKSTVKFFGAIEYAVDGSSVMLMYKGTVVRQINTNARTYKTFGRRIPRREEFDRFVSDEIGYDYSEKVLKLTKLLERGFSESPYCQFFNSVVETASRAMRSRFRELVEASVSNRDFSRQRLESLKLIFIDGFVDDPPYYRLSIFILEKNTEQFLETLLAEKRIRCGGQWRKRVSELAFFKADCFRVMGDNPPTTEQGRMVVAPRLYAGKKSSSVGSKRKWKVFFGCA